MTLKLIYVIVQDRSFSTNIKSRENHQLLMRYYRFSIDLDVTKG